MKLFCINLFPLDINNIIITTITKMIIMMFMICFSAFN